MSLDITQYPFALQLLMQTDGTVTELIKLLSQEKIQVKKLSEVINHDEHTLKRHIFLQGVKTKKNWLYAESKIYLNNLTEDFVQDLIEKSIPIGRLWIEYEIETYKKLIDQQALRLNEFIGQDFETGTQLLMRTYQVNSNKKIIMEITEQFPIKLYENIL